MEPTETIDTENTTPYRFKIVVRDELQGCVRTPKTKQETLEILQRDLAAAFGEQYDIVEFEEISDEEWDEAVLESNIETPTVLH